MGRLDLNIGVWAWRLLLDKKRSTSYEGGCCHYISWDRNEALTK